MRVTLPNSTLFRQTEKAKFEAFHKFVFENYSNKNTRRDPFLDLSAYFYTITISASRSTTVSLVWSITRLTAAFSRLSPALPS